MFNIPYIGNGAYCYSNSTAMLLTSIGENISPELIEVLGGVGLGAFQLENSKIAFLSNFSGLPDRCLSHTLKILGFDFMEEFTNSSQNAPFDKLREVLKESPAVLGPLDMGYLDYDPDAKYHFGTDHYILVYALDENKAYLHDPAGFPNATLTLDQLQEAWKAEKIVYREGYYRYWAKPVRKIHPTENQIYQEAIDWFKNIYQTGEEYGKRRGKKVDTEAILEMAEYLEKGEIKPNEISSMVYFIFPVGARRSSNCSFFFQDKDLELADLKDRQSKILGYCQVKAVHQDWIQLAKLLRGYSDLEGQFKQLLMGR